ncbi:MAG: hypothetical protein AAF483_21305 [Planctomycetota bacterium]
MNNEQQQLDHTPYDPPVVSPSPLPEVNNRMQRLTIRRSVIGFVLAITTLGFVGWIESYLPLKIPGYAPIVQLFMGLPVVIQFLACVIIGPIAGVISLLALVSWFQIPQDKESQKNALWLLVPLLSLGMVALSFWFTFTS